MMALKVSEACHLGGNTTSTVVGHPPLPRRSRGPSAAPRNDAIGRTKLPWLPTSALLVTRLIILLPLILTTSLCVIWPDIVFVCILVLPRVLKPKGAHERWESVIIRRWLRESRRLLPHAGGPSEFRLIKTRVPTALHTTCARVIHQPHYGVRRITHEDAFPRPVIQSPTAGALNMYVRRAAEDAEMGQGSRTTCDQFEGHSKARDQLNFVDVDDADILKCLC
jgi:hypothetical protein